MAYDALTWVKPLFGSIPRKPLSIRDFSLPRCLDLLRTQAARVLMRVRGLQVSFLCSVHTAAASGGGQSRRLYEGELHSS